MVAHCTINAHITQYLEFLDGFHATGKHFHTATVGNINNRLQKEAVIAMFVNAMGEAVVNTQSFP